jgi:hypothetical protein
LIPTTEEIVAYWARVEDECGLGVDWSEAHERCWRCGYRSALEKCHIVPAALGGTATAGNFVLLCGRCHREAPNHEDPQYMWRWIRATCVPLYDTYWYIRGCEEFEVMFGRKPFGWLTHLAAEVPGLFDEQQDLLDAEYSRVVIHFGEGRLNPATIACVLAEVEKAMAARHDVTLPALPPPIRARGGFMGELPRMSAD